MARRPTPGSRKHILDNAERLFRQHGARAVGMQQIIDACGCGKSLLYREFASKDELVISVLERAQQQWTADMATATRPSADDPAGQLVALVRAATKHVNADDYYGCPFRTTHAQFRDTDHPADKLAVRHIENLRAWLTELAERAGAPDAQTLGDQLLLVIDGIYINGSMLGAGGASTSAVTLAEQLVQAAMYRDETSSA